MDWPAVGRAGIGALDWRGRWDGATIILSLAFRLPLPAAGKRFPTIGDELVEFVWIDKDLSAKSDYGQQVFACGGRCASVSDGKNLHYISKADKPFRWHGSLSMRPKNT
jgi:hypothetical protein